MAPPDIDNVAMTTHTHTHRAAADDYSGQFESICSAAATGFSQECHMIKSCGLLFSPVVARLPFSCLDFPGAAGYLLLLSPAMILHGLSTNTPFCSLFIYIYIYLFIYIYVFIYTLFIQPAIHQRVQKKTKQHLVLWWCHSVTTPTPRCRLIWPLICMRLGRVSPIDSSPSHYAN